MSRLFRSIAPVLLVLVFSTCAWAAEEHEYRWGDFAWRIINLVIFCAILWYFTGKLIRNFFRNRRQGIQDTLDELEKRRAEARENLAEIERRIANLEAERKAILDESKTQAERLKKGILDDAAKQANQIVEQARRAAENEGRAALDKVRATVAEEIVEAAAKGLQDKLTADDHNRLIDNSLDKVAF